MSGDWSEFKKLVTELLEKRAAADPVWWSEQLATPNKLAPGGLLGPAVDALPATEWDGGATTWDGGETKWDLEPVRALNFPVREQQRLQPARWYDDRFPAWARLKDNVLMQADLTCEWCVQPAHDEPAIDARPRKYRRQANGQWDYYMGGKAYEFVALCGECTVKHDLENGGGVV